MKKFYYFLFAIAAIVLTGCADDGSAESGNDMSKSQIINFGFTAPNMQRADYDYVGSKAAEKIDKEFVVFGTKHIGDAEDWTADNDQIVYANYKVTYKPNTAGTTASNSTNWEYVDETPYAGTLVSPAISVTDKQTIKYWDYSAVNGYTFTAFAAKTELEDGYVTITKLSVGDGANATKYGKGYVLTTTKDAKLDNIYYSDRVEVAMENYGNPVTLTFRNLGSRVRVGFYSTIKGYTVKINKFYYDKDASTAVTTYKDMKDENNTNFVAAIRTVNSSAASGNIITVKYNDETDLSITNHPTVTNTTVEYANALVLGDGIIGATLASTATAPTWDNNGGEYTTVFPNEACEQPMLIRCDYTLTSADGCGETIEVKNARVVVPVEFMKWKPNFAYTYIFKISDKTNGTTGKMPTDPDNPSKTDDPEGLHPITFDAVVVDATTGNQETVSTISTNSITTYANGSKVTDNGEYKNGETIYAVVESTVDKKVISPSNIGSEAGQARFVKLSKPATESELRAQLNGAKMNIDLIEQSNTIAAVIPAADGTSYNVSSTSFTPTTAGTYAFIYTDIAYKAAEYESVASAEYSNQTYYFRTNDGFYYTASGITATNFADYKNELYIQTAPVTAGLYDIKVITVK